MYLTRVWGFPTRKGRCPLSLITCNMMFDGCWFLILSASTLSRHLKISGKWYLKRSGDQARVNDILIDMHKLFHCQIMIIHQIFVKGFLSICRKRRLPYARFFSHTLPDKLGHSSKDYCKGFILYGQELLTLPDFFQHGEQSYFWLTHLRKLLSATPYNH